MNIFKTLSLSVLLTLCLLTVFAQKANQEKLFNEMISVCSEFKKSPLMLEMEWKKQVYMDGEIIDSAAANGFFSISNKDAYIKFAEMEQIMQDTLLLIVMNDIKHMVLKVRPNEPIDQLLRSLPGAPGLSAAVLKEKYQVSVETKLNQTEMYISNKEKIPGTDLYIDEMTIVYDRKTREPSIVITKKNILIKIDTTSGIKTKNVISIQGKGEFVLRLEINQFIYKSISHKADEGIAQIMRDRIKYAHDSKEYLPVGEYADYQLSFDEN